MADACLSDFTINESDLFDGVNSLDSSKKSSSLFSDEAERLTNPFKMSNDDSQERRDLSSMNEIPNFLSSHSNGEESEEEDGMPFNLSDLGDLLKAISPLLKNIPSLVAMFGLYKMYNVMSNPSDQAGIIKNITRTAKEELLNDTGVLEKLFEKAGDTIGERATAKVLENPVVQKFTSDEGQDALAEKIGKRVGKEIENELKNSPAVKKVEKIADAVGGMLGVKKEEETVVPSGDGSISAQVASQQHDISSLPPQVVRTVAWNYIKSFWPLG